MIPTTITARKRSSYDFEGCYNNLCARNSVAPLSSVKTYLEKNQLNLNGDKIKLLDWSPILEAVKINKTLKYIAIKSFYHPFNSSGKDSHYFRRRTPTICSKEVTAAISDSLAECLALSTALKCLDLQGVPLRKRDVQKLAKGIACNHSLSHILLDYCQIGDIGVDILCKALKNHPAVSHLSLTGCNISPTGTTFISKLICHQSILRHSEAWVESLRYRIPNLHGMGGIRRVTLNSNPMIGDDGIKLFIDALKDDLWLKALDLQNCGISTQGVFTLMPAVELNTTLVVLDIRSNPMIDSTAMRSLLQRVLMNASEMDDCEYPWIKEETPKDPYHTKRVRPVRSNKSFSKKNVKFQKKKVSTEGNLRTLVSSRSKCIPKKAVAVSSLHIYRDSDNDTFSDEESHVPNIHANDTVDSGASSSFSVNHKSKIGVESNLTLIESQVYIKQLKVDLIDSQRRMQAAMEDKKRLHERIMNLEVENARLQKELADSHENSRIKSQLDDETLLENIETSFNKFHGFLNLLNGVGLGSLAAAAGVDGEFLQIQDKQLDVHNKNKDNEAKVVKTIANQGYSPVKTPIIIDGNQQEQINIGANTKVLQDVPVPMTKYAEIGGRKIPGENSQQVNLRIQEEDEESDQYFSDASNHEF